MSNYHFYDNYRGRRRYRQKQKSEMMKPDGYLYPPPKKATGMIRACVVEKKGDETRTSMRQSEIYAYSPDIRIRDGYMVMPKYFWSAYSPGDWFLARPIYAIDRFNREGDERELSELQKINPASLKELKLPPTKVEHGNVQIKSAFVFCPEFIRNKELRNSSASYKKLYVMNIGQGFVANWKKEFKLRQDKTYIGIFEFRAKDNGAVNFSHRCEVRDHTNHVLERDAMWELISVIAESVTIGVQQEMQDSLERLLLLAQEFDQELENNKSAMKPSSLLDDSMANSAKGSILSSMNNLNISNESKQSSKPTSNEDDYDDSQDVTLTNPDDLVFYTMQQLEEYRKEVIVLTKKFENGQEIEKWVDMETGESCLDDDILIFKFNIRHPITEKPKKRVIPNGAIQEIPMERNNLATTHPQLRSRTFSSSSVRSNTLGVPLASSTPMPTPLPTPRHSPVRQRRNMTLQIINREIEENSYNETQDFSTQMNQTTDTVLLCRDNNANPIHDRRLRR